ncbi:MAG: DivIVA domain-containing protein [Pseudomonadota bacterium]|nr:DivIVA domain-containing protein [Pseudomonadota bacterium]
MALTPLDILQKQFGPARKGGYDPEEVHRFLDEVREAWEGSLKENLRLREELGALDDAVETLRSEQDEIRQTLILARRMAVDLENTARREVDVLVGEARLEAERILAAAHEERRSLQEELVHMKSTRLHHLAQMRALVDAHGRMLDAIEAQD